MRLLILSIILSGIIWGQNQIDPAIADIQQRIETWAKALSQAEFNQLKEFYDDRFVGVSPYEKDRVGKKSVVKRFQNMYQGRPWTIYRHVEEMKVEGTMAYVRLFWRLGERQPNGEVKIKYKERSLSIWEKDDQGQWHISRTYVIPIQAKK